MALNMSITVSALSALLLLTVLATGADAATWRVEKDGTGDFTTIRPAIAASAPGDTILLGPGRYEEVEPFETPGWTEPTYVPITVDSLVLRGVDRDAVIIGPTESSFLGLGPKGVVAAVMITRFVLENVTIEHVRDGVYLEGRSDVRDCVLQSCDSGIIAFTTGSTVERTRFSANEFVGVWTGTGCSNLLITQSTFEAATTGAGIYVNRTTDAVIEECQFTDNLTDIQYAENATGRIQGCASTSSGGGIVIRAGSDVWVSDNHVVSRETALLALDGAVVRGSGNVFRGGYAAIAMRSTSTAFMSSNHILRNGSWSVHCEGFTLHPIDIDLRNNFWGTDSADSIAAWIYDGNDSPPWETNLSNVLFEPFSPVPIPTKPESLGGLKSRFRPRD